MKHNEPRQDPSAQSELLTRELDEAELFVQKLRACVVAIRDQLAAGHTGRALSMCNQALTDIDSATDVVAPSPRDAPGSSGTADLANPGGSPPT